MLRPPFQCGYWLALIIPVLFTGLLLAAAPASGQDPSDPVAQPGPIDAARAILDARFQTELPEAREPVILDSPAPLLPNFLIKILLALGLALLVLVAFRWYLGSQGAQADGADGPGDQLAGLGSGPLQLPDPEELAAAGRFREAIHALLLRALAVLAARLDQDWPRSLTSREILRHPRLPASSRRALGQLIQRVEIFHFGGLDPVAADFSRCQEIYEQLATTPAGGSR